MSLTAWFVFFLIVQVVHFAGTWKLYVAAGRKAWEALVPVYNAVVLMKIINRPWWWVILIFVPIVNLMMFPAIWVETIRSFGFHSKKDTWLVLLTLGFYTYYINYTQKLEHIPDRSLKPRTSAGEWVSSILFAVVAATIVHTYFIQPFTIPSSSLEKTLLVGDFLFVSKFHYGARTPMTTVAMPMVHDTVPVAKVKSYFSKPQLPYFRIPGFQDIERNDIVVFNWPVDTLIDIRPGYMRGSVQKPIDKKTNYVKRCVAIAGDSLEIRNGYVYINGEKSVLPDRAKVQFAFKVVSKRPLVMVNRDGNATNIPSPTLYDRFKISDIGVMNVNRTTGEITHVAHITEEVAEQLRNFPDILSVERIANEPGDYDPNIFPYSENYAWNTEFFGPIYIPEAGKTVAITTETIPFYKRIIETYEGSEMGIDNTITLSGTQVLLNGSPLTEYTFKMDYYWMMGDNRNNSQDARSWGYVPYNHVVGKPVFIWMSWDGNKSGLQKIRWERLFTTVGGSGEPVSYFKYFLIFLAGLYVFNFVRKKRKAKTS